MLEYILQIEVATKRYINLASALKSATIKSDDANIDDDVSKLTIKGKGQTDTLTDYIY